MIFVVLPGAVGAAGDDALNNEQPGHDADHQPIRFESGDAPVDE